MFYVYIDYTADTDEPFYIGKGNKKRIKCLKRNKKHTNVKIKHGIVRHCVFESEDEDLVFNKERELIAEHHTFVHDPLAGYLASNFTQGGEGTSGHIESDEKRKKRGKAISKSHKESSRVQAQVKKLRKLNRGRSLSRKEREKRSKAGKESSRVKTHLEKLNKSLEQKEHLEKLREMNKGRSLSQEHRENLSKAHKESSRAREQLKRLHENSEYQEQRRKQLEKLHEAQKGKPLSEERRKNISKALKESPHTQKRRKLVFQYTLDSELIATHESIKAASRSICGNIKLASSIGRVCRNKQKTCAGFIWRYASVRGK